MFGSCNVNTAKTVRPVQHWCKSKKAQNKCKKNRVEFGVKSIYRVDARMKAIKIFLYNSQILNMRHYGKCVLVQWCNVVTVFVCACGLCQHKFD